MEVFTQRLVAAAPPLNESQKSIIRRALREIRSIRRENPQLWTGTERRIMVDRRKRQLRISGPDRRKRDRRAA